MTGSKDDWNNEERFATEKCLLAQLLDYPGGRNHNNPDLDSSGQKRRYSSEV